MAHRVIDPSTNESSVVWVPPYIAEKMSGVHRKTLGRRGDAGKVTVRRTKGGHREFRDDEMRALRGSAA